jgi:hypothetical protein
MTAPTSRPATHGGASPQQSAAAPDDLLVAFARGQHDNDDTVEIFANAGMREGTIAALALLCDAPLDVVEYLMVEETLHVLVRAAGLSWRSAEAILRLCANGRSLASHQLEQCHRRFTRLTPDVAKSLLKFFRDFPPHTENQPASMSPKRLGS